MAVCLAGGEQRYAAEPLDHRDPATLFHRGWAQMLLTSAQTELRAGYAAAGKAELLAALDSRPNVQPSPST